MSLKAFHVVFVIVSTLLCIVFGVWSFRSYTELRESSYLLMAIGAAVGVVVLAWYFKWFLRKLKNVSYL